MSTAEERKAGTAAVFGRAAATYARVGPSFFPHFGLRLVALAAVAPGERVLDVACGTGAVAVPAQAAGADVLAVDLAPEMVEQTRARGIAAEVMDAERLDLPDASFDCVLSGFGVFFCPDPARALGEFHRVLRPGGRLAFTTFAEPNDERWAWERALRRNPPAPGPFDSRAGIEELTRAAGFAEPAFLEEDYELVFSDHAEWLEWKWSHGGRAELERKSPEELDAYARETSARLARMDPIAMTIYARLTVCTRPR